MEDFVRAADALVLNMGATECFEAMFAAARAAAAKKQDGKPHPVVIDPVGCAASALRRRTCLELIEAAHPACIRGNAAEIRALATMSDTARGVDDETEELPEAVGYAAALAKKTGAIVIATGAVDYIASGEEVAEVRAGTPQLKNITGSGCMLSALLGAFLAADPTAESAAACCLFMAKCGETAEARARKEYGKENRAGIGAGTFHMYLMDALSEEL